MAGADRGEGLAVVPGGLGAGLGPAVRTERGEREGEININSMAVFDV